DGDGLARCRGTLERMLVKLCIVDSVALQQSDFDGLAFLVMVAHASILAQDFSRADARATAAQDVLLQDADCGTVDVVIVDVADEACNINFGGTDAGAWRVVAIQAARTFDGGL